MKRFTILILSGALAIALFTLPALASPHWLPLSQPKATAEAAQWRARSAQATANAAWIQATEAAQATATASSIQMTATPAAATQRAHATRAAFEAQATQQALDLAATRTTYDIAAAATATSQAQMATATKAAAIATRDALLLEMDRQAIQRGRALQPLLMYGPWLALILCAALFTWSAWQLVPLLKLRLAGDQTAVGDVIEGEFYEPPAPPILLLPDKVRARPCVLRPIPPGERRRPTMKEEKITL